MLTCVFKNCFLTAAKLRIKTESRHTDRPFILFYDSRLRV